MPRRGRGAALALLAGSLLVGAASCSVPAGPAGATDRTSGALVQPPTSRQLPSSPQQTQTAAPSARPATGGSGRPGAQDAACADIAASLAFIGIAPFRLLDGAEAGQLDEFAAEARELRDKVPAELKADASRLESVLTYDGGGTGTLQETFDRPGFNQAVNSLQKWIDRTCSY
jgi:hypothetical protein